MTKLCGDKQCRRAEEHLGLSEFPINNASPDGRYYICKECAARKTYERRNGKPRETTYKYLPSVQRKAMFIAQAPNALTIVYDEIAKGPTTRNKIRAATGLDWDSITESLAELVFECRAVQIINREFVLVNSERVAA